MRGVYLVASELARLGFIVSPTSRSAVGADLLVTNQSCKKAFSVQVKTNSTTFNFWLTGHKVKETSSESHIYVLVNIKNTKRDGEQIEYYIVPSKVLTRRATHGEKWPSIFRDKIVEYKSKWSVFGSPI